uniref:Tick transposon n=1 Tax=Rhipicephalus pulchellus TaxID=72859 RepID=L7LUX4_RHIPC
MRFGHVSAVCQSTIICSRCAEPHAADSCASTVLKCRYCLGSHDASSNDCPKIQREKEILKQMVRDRSSRREAVAIVRMRRFRRRSGSRDSAKRNSQVTPTPLLPRPDTSESSSGDKSTPDHMDTEAWPTLPKLRPEPQSEPQPQTKPEHNPQRLQRSQQTMTDSTTALVPHDLPENDQDIRAMLRSILDTIFMLLNKLNTPTARNALTLLEVLNPVFSALQ